MDSKNWELYRKMWRVNAVLMLIVMPLAWINGADTVFCITMIIMGLVLFYQTNPDR